MAALAPVALAGGLLLAAGPSTTEDRPWYAPDHASLQLAGNVGFLSPGLGWDLGRPLALDVLLGWVPEALGGTDIFSLSAKLTWAPWSVDAGPWRWRPFTTSLQATYTFGDQYFVVPRFPFTPTAIRTGVGFGGAGSHAAGGRRVWLYGELVALDVPLVLWLTNREALGPQDVFSLAIGARLEL
jgi:hypothetical protein